MLVHGRTRRLRLVPAPKIQGDLRIGFATAIRSIRPNTLPWDGEVDFPQDNLASRFTHTSPQCQCRRFLCGAYSNNFTRDATL